MNKVRVAGAIASANGITLYFENGKEINLVKDSRRTQAILDQTVEALARKEIVEIDLDNFSIERVIEKKTNGLIRFMKTTASRLASLVGANLSAEETESILIGTIQRGDLAEEVKNQVGAVDQEVQVAIVSTPKGNVVIQNVDRLERQMEYAAYENVTGFKKFMERIAAVANERKHSVDELLNFMKKGDLPIADDGSIVAYKMLFSTGDKGVYVDPHTRKVRQEVGSRVSMPIANVDDNRRVQCSTGLHIARRGYIMNFRGDVITIVKVAPEDVIAVPHNEPDKMRAAAYHIVAKIPAEGANLLRANKPMTTHKESAQLLADVIAGNHPPVTQHVLIKGSMGTDVEITDVNGKKIEPIKSTGNTVSALDDAKSDGAVSIKDLRDRADKAINEKKVEEAKKPEPVKAEAPKKSAAKKTEVAKKVEKVKPKVEPAKAEPKKAKPAKAEPKKSVTKKTEAPAKSLTKATVAVATALPEKHKKALQLHKEGKTGRESAAELHICRKTLAKLIAQHG